MSETLITNDGAREIFHDNQISSPVKSICWSAVFTGVIAAFIVHILIALLGTASGASATINLQQNYLQHLSTRILVWTSLNMLLAIAVGSYVAGRFAYQQGTLHGLLVFGISTITMLCLAVSVTGNLIGGVFNMIGIGANIVKPYMEEKANNELQVSNIGSNDLYIPLQNILILDENLRLKKEKTTDYSNNQKNIGNIISSSNNKMDIEIPNWIYSIVGKYYDKLSLTDRDIIKNIIKNRTGKNDQEVEQFINQIKQIYQINIQYLKKLKLKTEQTARKAAEQTAVMTAKISWYTFFLLLVEILLAARMGIMGQRSHQINE